MKKLKMMLAAAFAAVGFAAGAAEVGVTVNGVDVSAGSGTGWTYADGVLTLSADQRFELSGRSEAVAVQQQADATVVFDSLSLTVKSGTVAPYDVKAGVLATILLKGENSLINKMSSSPGGHTAGLMVGKGAVVTINTAEGETDETATLNAKGSLSGAGIGGGRDLASGKIVINGGHIVATGGLDGSGIGGGSAGGKEGEEGEYVAHVEINGGRIEARGGSFAAGIGVGYGYKNGLGCTVKIAGGRVTAKGGDNGSGIGCSYSGRNPAEIVISGGTVTAQCGSSEFGYDEYTCADIGGSYWNYTRDINQPKLTVKGGNVIARNYQVRANPYPVNDEEARLWCVTVNGVADGAAVIEGLPDSYDVAGIEPVDGKICLWLPDGTHSFTVNGAACSATVAEADVNARTANVIGVTVNGVDVGEAVGEGWFYVQDAVHLTGEGPFVLSGSNTLGAVRFLQEASGTVTLSNLVLETSANYSPYEVAEMVTANIRLAGRSSLVNAFDDEYSSYVTRRNAGLLVVSNATVVIDKAAGYEDATAILYAKGGASSAGIGAGGQHHNGDITIAGGTVIAQGGYDAAGIGIGSTYSSDRTHVGTVRITGGIVEATGGYRGAGIGAAYSYGSEDAGGVPVVIEGGSIRAVGGSTAPGIGCMGSFYGGGATPIAPITILGGTVYATGEEYGKTRYAIGGGTGCDFAGYLTFGGGNIVCDGLVKSNPSNGTERVWCVTVDGLADGAAAIEGLPGGYNVTGIESVDGKVCLWLPNGHYAFRVGDRPYEATVNDGDTTATPVPVGVTVNGRDVAYANGEGWTYADNVLTLSGAGPFVLSGTNTESKVFVKQIADSTVVLSNLVLETCSADGLQPPYMVAAGEDKDGAIPVHASLCLVGTNRLVNTSTKNTKLTKNAAIFVHRGSSLVIETDFDEAAQKFAPNESGVLEVRGGYGGAGIGGGKDHSTGLIEIIKGTVVATGGYGGAGIGGGWYHGTETQTLADEGMVEITGGRVTATGGANAPGIGCGYGYQQGEGFTVIITGGTVVADGGTGQEYGIMAAPDSFSKSVEIIGGSVKAKVLNAMAWDSPNDEKIPAYCVTVPELADGELSVDVSWAYGVDDIVPLDGNVYLWLPNGQYTITANADEYMAVVEDKDTVAFKVQYVTVGDVKVPYSWIESYALADHGTDYATHEAAVLKDAANPVTPGATTRFKVWESYVAGLDPTDPEDMFYTVIKRNEDGRLVVSPNEEKAGCQYQVFGSETPGFAEAVLVDHTSHVVDEKSPYRFFRVAVERGVLP